MVAQTVGIMKCDELVMRLLATLPWPGAQGRKVCAALAARRGLLGEANAFARSIGFGSRHQLHKFLKRHGLRSISRIAGWARLLTLAVETTHGDLSLEDVAWRDGVDPSVEHRRIRRLLGSGWRDAMQQGVNGMLVAMWQDCLLPAGRHVTSLNSVRSGAARRRANGFVIARVVFRACARLRQRRRGGMWNRSAPPMKPPGPGLAAFEYRVL